MNKKQVFAVIPAYNEETKIEQVIRDIDRYVDKIVVVDDASTDKTVDKVKNKKAMVLKHLINLGPGAAIQTGFEYAAANDADIVITFDADGQFKSSEIPLLIRPIVEENFDVVLGSRFLGKALNIPRSRLFIIKMGILFTRVFLGVKLTDTHNGFRALNRRAIKTIKISQNRWAHPSDIMYQIIKNKLRYKEVPVTILYNEYTKRKGQKNLNALGVIFDLITERLV